MECYPDIATNYNEAMVAYMKEGFFDKAEKLFERGLKQFHMYDDLSELWRKYSSGFGMARKFKEQK